MIIHFEHLNCYGDIASAVFTFFIRLTDAEVYWEFELQFSTRDAVVNHLFIKVSGQILEEVQRRARHKKLRFAVLT